MMARLMHAVALAGCFAGAHGAAPALNTSYTMSNAEPRNGSWAFTVGGAHVDNCLKLAANSTSTFKLIPGLNGTA